MKLRHWAKDYLYAARLHAGRIAGNRRVKDGVVAETRNFPEENKRPIVLIPGLLGTWHTMKPVVDALLHKRYPVYVPDIGNNTAPIPHVAAKIADFIKTRHLKNVAIVANSKGGVVGKYLLAFHTLNYETPQNPDDEVQWWWSWKEPLLYPMIKTSIQVYDILKHKVQFLYAKLKLRTREKKTGRKLAISPVDSMTLALFWKKQNIATKKSVFEMFAGALSCTYKTFVVSLNRFARCAMIMLALLLKWNRTNEDHLVKHTDSTDIPVCSVRKARHHKTMAGLASWGKTGKGWFYGLKLHLTANLKRKILAVRFTSGNSNDREVVIKLNRGLFGIFLADAGYISQKLQREFFIEHKRILFVKPRANMKKIATAFQNLLYGTRMMIELDFRSLKMFYGLITSLPRSVNGYCANYIHSLLAYCIA